MQWVVSQMNMWNKSSPSIHLMWQVTSTPVCMCQANKPPVVFMNHLQEKSKLLRHDKCINIKMITCICSYRVVLLSHREVPMKEAKEFAESIAAIFIETSARNAVNVEELFQKISRFHFFNSMLCMNIYYFESWQGEGSVRTEKTTEVNEWTIFTIYFTVTRMKSEKLLN